METLETIAEIAVTLIGFVGLLFALRSRTSSIAVSDLYDFLQSAIGALLFAFLPILLGGVLVDESILWRVCCLLFAIYHAAIMMRATWLHARQRGAQFFSPWLMVFVVASVLVIGLKFAVGLGYLRGHGYEVYLLGLVWLILNCLVTFYGIVMKSIANERG